MKTILLLDDDPSILSTFSLALQHHGYNVIEASSGEEGLKLARKHLPDLILSDISMPGTGGQAVLQSIREDPELSTMQVVLMTGQTHIVTSRRGMELGADDFLTKPVSLSELLQCVEARFKRAQVHWRVEDRMLGQLRSTLHSTLPHELFTPLGGIIGLAEILSVDLPNLSQDEAKELLDDIHLSALCLHRTLRNYLMILEGDAISDGSTAPAAKALSPESFKESIVSGLRSTIRRNPRAKDVQLDIEKCAVVAVPNDVSVITEELVDNACKFSGKDAPVHLHVGADAVLTVTDHGRGMTPEEVDQVGSFHQFDRKKFEQQGLGLGLCLVQKLAGKCGATLSIESQPTAGTTAKVAFQLAGS
jgi:two-component system sensor histidine kinase/response regulator